MVNDFIKIDRTQAAATGAAEDANVLVTIPAAAYVEQVYRQGNFADMGIGG